MKILITGGSGLIGRALTDHLAADGHKVVIVSRKPERIADLPAGASAVGWGSEAFSENLEGADAVVNLAGSSIAGEIPFKMRWTPSRKQQILESRLRVGRLLTEAIKSAKVKPRVLVQSSGVGIYGPLGDEHAGEHFPDGNDWLATVARAWEDSTISVETMGVRRAIIRTGLVLSERGGIFSLLKLPFSIFAGGPIGSGRQYLPWIHIDDEVRAIRFLIENETASGPYNLSVPEPATNKAFGQALGRAMRRPFWLPAPAFALRLILGEVSTLALDGQRAVPNRLLEAGFQFQYEKLEGALAALLGAPMHFKRAFTVDAPLEAVAAFHASMKALQKLTPFPIIVQLKHFEPVGEGSTASFNIWFGPLPVHWLARHHDYDPIRGFTDTQDEGPFSLWVHRHTFAEIDTGKTIVVDHIRAKYGRGLFSALVSRSMWPTLPILFAFRKWQTRRLVRKILEKQG